MRFWDGGDSSDTEGKALDGAEQPSIGLPEEGIFRHGLTKDHNEGCQ